MKEQTIQEMINLGATENEAKYAAELFRVLRPALRVKHSNGRIETTHGDKTALGLFRTVYRLCHSYQGNV